VAGQRVCLAKNIRPLAGLPLIAHSIRFAALCPEIDRCIVSTDSDPIANCARQHGGEVPFLRPSHLALDDTAMIPVLQHTLRETERLETRRYESLLLLDPTSPGRLPADVTRALAMLEEDPACIGVVGVSEPHFNPRYTCVEERNGYLALAFAQTLNILVARTCHRFTGSMPHFTCGGATIFECAAIPIRNRCQAQDIGCPENRAIHIDSLDDFQLAEILIRDGVVQLPWLEAAK